MSAVPFTQPAVVEPAHKCPYFYTYRGEVYSDTWGTVSAPQGVDAEFAALERGEIYLSREACELRIAYDAQEMARLVIPAWFRALGPDVECAPGNGRWERVLTHCVADWSKEHPSRFRAKPTPAPDVVHALDGVEYRWPATVTEDAPRGDRFYVSIQGVSCVSSASWGSRTHHTLAGAEAQNAMLVAALGAGS